MNKVKQALMFLESKLYGFLKAQSPVLHTAWEATLPTLYVLLVSVHSTADVKVLIVTVGTVFLAALKASYLKLRG